MLPVSLWPVFLGTSGKVYGAIALLLGAVYLFYTLRFARITRDLVPAQSRAIARDLLRVSVIHLPLLLMAMVLDARGHISF